jgi:hypothetical protein
MKFFILVLAILSLTMGLSNKFFHKYMNNDKSVPINLVMLDIISADPTVNPKHLPTAVSFTESSLKFIFENKTKEIDINKIMFIEGRVVHTYRNFNDFSISFYKDFADTFKDGVQKAYTPTIVENGMFVLVNEDNKNTLLILTPTEEMKQRGLATGLMNEIRDRITFHFSNELLKDSKPWSWQDFNNLEHLKLFYQSYNAKDLKEPFFVSFQSEGFVLNSNDNYMTETVKYSFIYQQLLDCNGVFENIQLDETLKAIIKDPHCCVAYNRKSGETPIKDIFCSTYSNVSSCKTEIKLFNNFSFKKCVIKGLQDLKFLFTTGNDPYKLILGYSTLDQIKLQLLLNVLESKKIIDVILNDPNDPFILKPTIRDIKDKLKELRDIINEEIRKKGIDVGKLLGNTTIKEIDKFIDDMVNKYVKTHNDSIKFLQGSSIQGLTNLTSSNNVLARQNMNINSQQQMAGSIETVKGGENNLNSNQETAKSSPSVPGIVVYSIESGNSGIPEISVSTIHPSSAVVMNSETISINNAPGFISNNTPENGSGIPVNQKVITSADPNIETNNNTKGTLEPIHIRSQSASQDKDKPLTEDDRLQIAKYTKDLVNKLKADGKTDFIEQDIINIIDMLANLFCTITKTIDHCLYQQIQYLYLGVDTPNLLKIKQIMSPLVEKLEAKCQIQDKLEIVKEPHKSGFIVDPDLELPDAQPAETIDHRINEVDNVHEIPFNIPTDTPKTNIPEFNPFTAKPEETPKDNKPDLVEGSDCKAGLNMKAIVEKLKEGNQSKI